LVALAIRFGGSSEAALRLFPAFLSSLAIPLVLMVQQELSPRQERGTFPHGGFFSGLILMTTLPMVRHGRLLMLDGAMVSAALLLWWGMLLLQRRPLLGSSLAGSACSGLLLLKPPATLGFLAVGGIALLSKELAERRELASFRQQFFPLPWLKATCCFLLGSLPGLGWHGWHIWQRGVDAALIMWGAQGLGRLTTVLDGHHQGWSMPALEVLKGGWPWLLFLPAGLLLALHQWHEGSSAWRLALLVGTLLMVLSLKTQLPWYSHCLWPPLALLEGSVLSKLWRGQRVAGCRLGYPLMLLGLALLLVAGMEAVEVEAISSLPLLSLLIAGAALCMAGFGLQRGANPWALGTLVVGWWLALLCFWTTPHWIWELNENWPTQPVGELLRTRPDYPPVFSYGSERPSLSWYAGHRISALPHYPPDIYGLVVPGQQPIDGCQIEVVIPRPQPGRAQNQAVSLQWCHN